MAEDYGPCSLCREGRLIKKGESEIGGATYFLLKCNKCNHEVARNIK
ncbi:hypothetical protein KY366_01850 [Candidatus Woesearchaeota archaeon]|nr:hypothetical protein [Candidatus Woesearchaeota archaeon]